MRKYRVDDKELLESVVCNQCGRELKVEGGYLKEGCFDGQQIFGYFSKRDGLRHRFDLCENCYEKWIGSFTVPVTEEEVNELL